VLQIYGQDGTTNPQSSVAVNVTVTPASLTATYSVLYSNIDPTAHTGRTATLIAAVTGGTPPYIYQWSGGGGQGNRLPMTSPLLDTAGTLTISDSSQSPPLSIPATIKVSPVVPEEALYVSVLQRVLAMDRFGAALAAEGRDRTAVRSAILNQANLQQPTLTPDEYDRLVVLARNFDAERSTISNQYRPLLTALNGQTPQDQSLKASSVAQLGMPPRYLAMVKAADTGIGAAFAPFSTFAWANYAPNVERFLPNPTGEFTLYLDHAIAQDPGTGKISVTSWASVDSLGYYGNEVDLNETLYHVAGGDEWHFQSDHGAGFAAVTLALQPGHIGDFYQSDADASARVFNQDGTASAVANTSVSVLANSCRPVIRDDAGGFVVDGLPTNGFVAGPGSGRSGSITIYGQCMDDVTQITFSGLPGLTATRKWCSGAGGGIADSRTPNFECQLSGDRCGAERGSCSGDVGIHAVEYGGWTAVGTPGSSGEEVARDHLRYSLSLAVWKCGALHDLRCRVWN
jgi:hypothetical protein